MISSRLFTSRSLMSNSSGLLAFPLGKAVVAPSNLFATRINSSHSTSTDNISSIASSRLSSTRPFLTSYSSPILLSSSIISHSPIASSSSSTTMLVIASRAFAKDASKLTGAQKAAQKAVAQRKKEAREAKKKVKAKLLTQKKTKKKKEPGPLSIHEIPPPKPLRRTKPKPVVEHFITSQPSRIPKDPIAGLQPAQWKDVALWKHLRKDHTAHDLGHLHKVFPQVYGAFIPAIPLTAQFAKAFNVYHGNTIRASFTKEEPKVWWSFNPDADEFYTLALVDLDSPGVDDKSASPFVHWLVMNIPSNLVKKGKTVVEYIQPIPSKSTGAHRYAFLVFLQKEGTISTPEQVAITTSGTTITAKDLQGRAGFSLKELGKRAHLAAKGLAFFKAEWDESVCDFYTNRSLQEPSYVLESQIPVPKYVAPGRKWI